MKKIVLLVFLVGCVAKNWVVPSDFVYAPIKTDSYTIATWQKINNPNNKAVHIYIEGDGHAFDAYGQATYNPTPKETFLRDLAAQDSFDNVVYVARPCQFIMDEKCSVSDWTVGRFSQKIIDSESFVIKKIAADKKISLIGYSGGAMISGLVIEQNPQLKIEKWITIAGVLNHKKWTEYFGDTDLSESINLENLPNVPQVHFVGEKDKVVPPELAKTWANAKDIKIIPNAIHDNFGDLKIFD